MSALSSALWGTVGGILGFLGSLPVDALEDLSTMGVGVIANPATTMAMTGSGAAAGVAFDAWLNGSSAIDTSNTMFMSGQSSSNSGKDCPPKKGSGGKGWRGDKNWRDLVRNIDRGGDVELGNNAVPTVEDANAAIEEAGGTVNRTDLEGHGPDSVSTHDYPHINFTTAQGVKGTIRIQ